MAYTINAPVSGAQSRIEFVPGEDLAFSFALNDATLERSGSDLVITTDNGGSVTLANFFVAGESDALPHLVLEDGTSIDSETLLTALYPDMDISTAAGASPQGGGSSSYNADPGALVDGVERLGNLDDFRWTNTSPTNNIAVADAPTPGASTPAEPEPEIPPFALSFNNQVVVSEAGLESGSAAHSNMEETRGVFTLSNPKGAVEFAVNGETVDLARLAQGYQQEFTTAGWYRQACS